MGPEELARWEAGRKARREAEKAANALLAVLRSRETRLSTQTEEVPIGTVRATTSRGTSEGSRSSEGIIDNDGNCDPLLELASSATN